MKRLLLLTSLALTACLTVPTATPTGTPAIASPTPSPAIASLTPSSTPISDPGPNLCTVTADALHIRSGAGVTYSVIGYLKAGDIVTVVNQRGAWYDIGVGWIHSNYCKE